MILAVFLISIFVFLLLGIPVAFSILMTVFTMAEASGVTSYDIVPSYLYSGVNNFALLAIPFFVFCGDLMTAGDLSKGIVDFCRVLLGHIRAGIGYAAILACMILIWMWLFVRWESSVGLMCRKAADNYGRKEI